MRPVRLGCAVLCRCGMALGYRSFGAARSPGGSRRKGLSVDGGVEAVHVAATALRADRHAAPRRGNHESLYENWARLPRRAPRGGRSLGSILVGRRETTPGVRTDLPASPDDAKLVQLDRFRLGQSGIGLHELAGQLGRLRRQARTMINDLWYKNAV